MDNITIFLFLSTLCSILIATSTTLDTISSNQTIRDDANNTIESAGGIFQLGFFSPGISKNRYVGIWYKKISNKTVVWVANRETPLADNSGILRVDLNGDLVIIDGRNSTIWSSNSSRSVINPVAQLLDTGNLVLGYENDNGSENYLWQSFDHPGDHLLPGMKLGWDLSKGLERYVTSPTSVADPSPGNYTFRTSLSGFPQLVVQKGSLMKFRFGPWNGVQLGGSFASAQEPNFEVKFVSNQKETYYTFNVINNSIAMRLVLNQDGDIKIFRWLEQTQIWSNYLVSQQDDCDHFAFCGAYGSCDSAQPQSGNGACGCLKGYEPKFPEKQKLANWPGGCVRKSQFDCWHGDEFIRYPGLKVPDTQDSWFNESMGLEECQSTCLKNCSCTAYSSLDIRQGGLGCLLWFNDLLDIRDDNDNGLDLYVRIAASELEAKTTSRAKKRVTIIIATVSVVLALLLGLFLVHVFWKRMRRRKESDSTHENEREDLELPLFDFSKIADATNNFSEQNKLGEGGFGPVYKGILDNGQEIAVKRLSKDSKQGLDEFKNEVSCIAKLQHRNLVRLLGCCIVEGEMLLIYEYMPNKSLDSFLFDKELGKTLNWPKRYNIINGIARGLLYLHQDSRLRIIHRDLKASNILLDYEMNPRISDFGMARIFGGTQTAANTTRVVGTYGYMSPEYALDGLFSVKSDVYSFGILVLEIVSGNKMRGFYQPANSLNLLDYSWNLYKEGEFLELIDKSIIESCDQSEVSRTIQIGLLCVNTYPEDRPTMSFVVSMLNNETALPQPMQPGFFTRNPREPDHLRRKSESFISNELSITFIGPR